MVLWELTLVTAYVLGLKRTYRLALRSQRRILGTKYPRIRDFTERKTKSVFTIALNFHKEIQRRDISARRSISNWMLRWLDRARPQADIRGSSTSSTTGSQVGPGKSTQPKIDNNKTGQSKHQAQAVQVDGFGSSGLSSQTTTITGPFGSTLRNRISNGFKFRARPVIRPLPSLSSFGLWWQPTRRQSISWHASVTTPSALSSMAIESIPAVRVLQSGLGQGQGSVFRPDIRRLMESPGKY